MLKKNSKSTRSARGRRFAIVASRYNARYVEAMLRAAKAELKASGAAEVRVVRVPGAFEIPVVAASLAQSDSWRPDAIICLGVILRGATTHAQQIGEAVTFGLTEIQIATEVPVIHEVLLLENEQQAKERCLPGETNRGVEAARTALEMAAVMAKLAPRE